MIFRLNALGIWENVEVRQRLSWYYAVMCNKMPAKFLICKRISADIDLQDSDEALWSQHNLLSNQLKELLRRISSGELMLKELEPSRQNFLDLKIELVKRILCKCHLCEWRCNVDRVEGKKKGACKLDSTSLISTWFHHFGEEPPLVGSGGSGTIFFTGCTFRCVFCQNWDISQDSSNGSPIDGRRLTLIMKNLRETGACNINFVGGEPTPNLHTILEGIKGLEINVPMLWNSNMYCSLETMKILSDLIDIWLPDFKYGNDKCALRLSKVVNYFDKVARNHKMASENGDMIIRHLVMPNHLECCTRPILEWVSKNTSRALVNVMNQYHPDHLVPLQQEKYREITRRLTGEEIGRAYSWAEELGLIYKPVS